MHILEKSSCCIDEKLKLKFVKTVIHLRWPLKVKNSFARKTRYKSVLRTAIVFLTHKEEGKCTNILFPVLCQGVWMINNNKRCNNIYFIFFSSENNLILPKQSGFRARYSSTNQLLSIAQEILAAFAGSFNTKSQEYFSTYLKC